MAALSRSPRRHPNIPNGANPLTYKRGAKAERSALVEARMRAWSALPDEAKLAQQREYREYQEDLTQWRKDFDKFGPDKARELMLQRRDARAALNKLADREARVAVEGDTDLNYDNIEAAE